MTIALIVANKDSIFVVADTLSRRKDFFTLNTQKVFFSQQQHIVLCIAGEARLKPLGLKEGEEEKSLYVDFVMREFFNYIESLPKFSIKDLEMLLHKYIKTIFGPEYVEPLKTGVELFYGGFELIEGEFVPNLHAHLNSAGDGEPTQPQLLGGGYFTNSSTAVQRAISVCATQHGKLVEDVLGNKGDVFKYVIPLASYYINFDLTAN